MYEMLSSAYRELTNRHSLELTLVGDAFQLARQDPKWIVEYPAPSFDYANPAKDGFHLNAIHANTSGKYLAAEKARALSH